VRAYDGARLDLSTHAHRLVMTGKDKEREARLAAALREHLRKRKAQARELQADKRTDGKPTNSSH
jgi:hypothetical protein